MKRRFLGRYNNLATRSAVYETDLAIEVDEHDSFEIRRKRVFYEDVQLVTLHEQTSILGAFFGLGFSFFIFVVSALAAGTLGWKLAIFGLPFLALGTAFLVVKESIITVFGRRSKARIKFSFRKSQARRIYDDICARVRRAQETEANDVDQNDSLRQS